jgi:MYND finger
VAKLAPESPFYQRRAPGISDLEHATASAKLQFEAWCNAFRHLVKTDKPRRLIIRFSVGDAISFCWGLQALRELSIDPNCYSRPGTTRILKLETDKNHAKKPFDVIDTGYLVDRIGLLNILPHVNHLLQNSCSALYTSTWLEDVTAETDLLGKMLCADVGIMCMLFGVVPAAYLTGHTSTAYHEYLDSRPHTAIPLTNRIMWVMTKSGDHKLEFNRVSTHSNVAEFVPFLVDLYKNMFAFESSKTRNLAGNHAYTRQTFAFVLSYFKRRVFGIDWKECIGQVFRSLAEDWARNGSNLRQVMGELWVQFALCDVYLGGVDFDNKLDLGPVPPIGALKQKIPPDPCAMVITVRRSTLQSIYDKLNAHTPHPPIAFELYVRKESCKDKDCGCVEEYCRVSCVQSVFGKLVPAANGRSGTIEEDPLKWDGTSDLQVCGYISTSVIRGWGHGFSLRFGVALTRTNETTKLFEAQLGVGLSVFCTCLKHRDTIYFFDKLPGLRRPNLYESFFRTEDPVAESTSSFIVDFPVVDFEKPSYMTHIKVIGAALARLKKKENLAIIQLSPCTLTVTFGPFQVQGNYIFPVDGGNARIRVSRVNGWIEIIAPFVVPPLRGFFTSRPFPVVLSPWGPFYNTFRPYVNFRQLPKLDGHLTNRDSSNKTVSIPTHLMTMWTNKELALTNGMAKIKLHIHTLLFPYPKPPVFRFKSQSLRHVDILFFVAGLYLDPNSRSVVGEGYILPITANVSTLPRVDLEIKVYEEEMRWWLSALQSMVEQARMWKHGPNCALGAALPICHCGQGQVTSAFMGVQEWRKYASIVTPIAISPIFPAPWLDSTRRNIPEVEQEAIDMGGVGKKCKVCGEHGARKKCGKCMNVVYCSRECQVADWREHKASCGPAVGG